MMVFGSILYDSGFPNFRDLEINSFLQHNVGLHTKPISQLLLVSTAHPGKLKDYLPTQ